MRNTHTKVIAFVAALAAALIFTACKSTGGDSGSSTPSPPPFYWPTITVKGVDTQKVSFAGVDLLCTIRVTNRNKFDIPFPDMTWDFFVDEFAYKSDVITRDVPVKGNGWREVSVPIRVDYSEILAAYILLAGKNIDCKFIFDAKMSLSEHGKRVWHAERDGNFPIMVVPAISFAGIELIDRSATKLDFELSLEVDNKNYMDLKVNDLAYNFAVNNSRWSSGRARNVPRLSANKKTYISIPFTINSLSALLEITRIITGNTEIQYAFKGDFDLGIDLPGVIDLETSYDASGITRIRR